TLHSDTSSCVLSSASGLFGVTGLRDSRRVRPQASGAVDETRWEDGRIISLSLEAWGRGVDRDAAHQDALANFREAVRPMLHTLRHGPALLKWTEAATGNELQRYVRLADTIDPPVTDLASRLRFLAQFFAEDPAA